MASARIAAPAVRNAANTKISELMVAETDAIEALLVKLESEPVFTGALWWKRSHYRTRAEALAAIDMREELGFGYRAQSARQSIENRYGRKITDATRLRDLAKAADQRLGIEGPTGNGDGFVTLDADEVRFLGLAVQP